MSEKTDAPQNSGGGRKMPKGRPFPPGVSGNPGGAPKGKRISTWMAELGEMTDAQIKKLGPLTQNAKIALARVKAAKNERSKHGNGATEIILDRTEGKVAQKLEGAEGGPLVIQVVSYATKAAHKPKNGDDAGRK